MGSSCHTLGMGCMGPAGRRERPGEQSKIFHIFEREVFFKNRDIFFRLRAYLTHKKELPTRDVRETYGLFWILG